MSNIITASVYRAHRKDRAKCTWVTCENHEQCGLYARGECELTAIFSCGGCPYGRKGHAIGLTKRARGCTDWENVQMEQHADHVNKLRLPGNVLAVVGDYVYLPYAHMNMNKHVDFLSHSNLFATGSRFVPRHSFTIATIRDICEFRPQALMGGEIRTYQAEHVPQFIIHLSERMPDMYAKLCEEYPRAAKIVENHSNVGRRAILETLTPNIGTFADCHKATWTWDGTYLTSVDSRSSFLPVKKFSEVRVRPASGEQMIVSDDGQVNDQTVFCD